MSNSYETFESLADYGTFKAGSGLRIAGKPDAVWYLATPYSKYVRGHDAANRCAVIIAAKLIILGYNVFSPIVHAHPLVPVYPELGTTAAAWASFNKAMLTRCDGLIVAEMEGWAESVGVLQEIEFMRAAQKPIVHLRDSPSA